MEGFILLALLDDKPCANGDDRHDNDHYDNGTHAFPPHFFSCLLGFYSASASLAVSSL